MEPEAPDLTVFFDHERQAWFITFNTDIPFVVGLFGTNTIMTPFTAWSHGPEVLAKIRSLNPHKTVELLPAGAEVNTA